MKSVKELNELKEKSIKEMDIRSSGRDFKIMVGMATCGMAAGADKVMQAIRDELEIRGIKNAEVVKTGCIGICRLEPIAEVMDINGERTTYVKLDPEKARRIVVEHIVNGKRCTDLVIGAYES